MSDCRQYRNADNRRRKPAYYYGSDCRFIRKYHGCNSKYKNNIIERGENMVQLYVALIKAGRKTLDDVPEKYREAVKKELGA